MTHDRPPSSTLHVLIIGGGIGGLCLAQGLKKVGISVAVYEADRSIDSRSQGYRLSINADGSGALHACLPENLFNLYVATATQWTPQTMIAAFDHELNQRFLKALPTPPADDLSQLRTGVNRTTLREVLLSGLDGCVHFGKVLERFELLESGAVRAYFGDGTQAAGDMLVGADGTNSPVRSALLPAARLIELGQVIYGKTPITPKIAASVPVSFLNGMTRINSPDGDSLGVGAYQKRAPFPEITAKYAPAVKLTDTPDYLMWTADTPLLRRRLDDPGAGIPDPFALHDLVRAMTQTWHPTLKQLIAEADIAATFLVRIRAAEPVTPWPTARVTLLGDAIHTMTPARGVGANTALRDALLLSQKLRAVESEGISLIQALHEYETEMLRYGFEAVANSMQSAQQVRQGNSLFGF